MFSKFGGVIHSVIPACNCFFREVHVVKFPEASNKFMISDAAGNNGGILERITVVGSNYVNQGFRVTSYSIWWELRETKKL